MCLWVVGLKSHYLSAPDGKQAERQERELSSKASEGLSDVPRCQIWSLEDPTYNPWLCSEGLAVTVREEPQTLPLGRAGGRDGVSWWGPRGEWTLSSEPLPVQ